MVLGRRDCPGSAASSRTTRCTATSPWRAGRPTAAWRSRRRRRARSPGPMPGSSARRCRAWRRATRPEPRGGAACFRTGSRVAIGGTVAPATAADAGPRTIRGPCAGWRGTDASTGQTDPVVDVTDWYRIFSLVGGRDPDRTRAARRRTHRRRGHGRRVAGGPPYATGLHDQGLALAALVAVGRNRGFALPLRGRAPRAVPAVLVPAHDDVPARRHPDRRRGPARLVDPPVRDHAGADRCRGLRLARAHRVVPEPGVVDAPAIRPTRARRSRSPATSATCRSPRWPDRRSCSSPPCSGSPARASPHRGVLMAKQQPRKKQPPTKSGSKSGVEPSPAPGPWRRSRRRSGSRCSGSRSVR